MDEYEGDAYAELGVKKDATEKEIKTAYRKLALKHHPDRHSASDAATRDAASKKFTAIANAYEILSDEKLRKEYDRSRSENMSSYNSGSPGKGSSGGTSSEPAGFRYEFSDAYEVFKRDFREQFGIEYPGAKYDFVDFDEPIMNPSSPAMITDGKSDQKKGGKKQKKHDDSRTDSTEKPKKRGFNPFSRNKNKTDGAKDNGSTSNQIVVRKKDKVPHNQLAKTNNNSAIVNPSSNSTALVKVDKRNNRPISMDVQSKKEGKVTTTTTKITRPDGTVETVVMKQGLPGPAKKKPLMIENGTGKTKMLKSDGKEKNAMLTNGKNKKKKPKALANEPHNSSKPKRKLIGYGGKQ